MSTILTDDERRQLIQSIVLISPGTHEQISRAVESAVLAKLREQEPVAWLVEGMHEGRLIAHQVHLTSADALQLAAGFARHYPTVHTKPLYTHPAPQQADRCPECGYLKTHREHLGCLRKAVADLDSATGGPFGAQQADRQQIYDAATHASAMAVFMTRMDAEQPDADDKGVSGWLQDAEDRIRSRASQPLEKLISQADRQRVPDEPDWRHPKIQALIGADARNRICIDLVWRILENPRGEFTASDMEYWDKLHDKVQEVALAAAPEAPAQASAVDERQPLTPERVDELSHEMVRGNKSVNWLVQAIERAHGIGDSALAQKGGAA